MTNRILPISRSGKGRMADIVAFRRNLLQWYDKYARVLPWRARSGEVPDPYHVWLSEIMLQQTTVQAVIPYFEKFLKKWPSVINLAAAPDDDVMREWAGLGYYARARNLLRCARTVASDHGGSFPDHIDGLKELPGVGDYTAAAIASIAFNKPATVIDGNVDRVVSRWFLIQDPLPDSKPLIRERARVLFESNTDTDTDSARPGDFAQAMMDLGASICTPKNPKCMICPVAEDCQARIEGVAADLPRRKEKRPRPRKAGYVYWITNPRGEILFEKRADRGLLGGMVGLPTSDWVERGDDAGSWPAISHISATKIGHNAIMGRQYRVLHTFTHFELELRGVQLSVAEDFCREQRQFWISPGHLGGLGVPTLFRKFIRLMESRES